MKNKWLWVILSVLVGIYLFFNFFLMFIGASYIVYETIFALIEFLIIRKIKLGSNTSMMENNKSIDVMNKFEVDETIEEKLKRINSRINFNKGVLKDLKETL